MIQKVPGFYFTVRPDAKAKSRYQNFVSIRGTQLNLGSMIVLMERGKALSLAGRAKSRLGKSSNQFVFLAEASAARVFCTT